MRLLLLAKKLLLANVQLQLLVKAQTELLQTYLGILTTVTTRDIAKTSKKTAAAMCGNGETTQTTTSTFGSTTNTQVQTSSTTCAIK